MSFYENLSELARELRTAAGTVLTIVGSRLEADSRARVDEVGPQWLTEFEAEREVVAPGELRAECTCPTEECELLAEDICDEAEEDYPDYYTIPACPCTRSSAAVSAAADPSPAYCDATDYPVGRVVGGEGRKEDSCILSPASFRQPTDPGEVSAPSPGEQVREDDLAAHIMGDFVSGQGVDALTATLIDALSSRAIASALLTDFNITRKK